MTRKRKPTGGVRPRDPGALYSEERISRAQYEAHRGGVQVSLGLFFIRYLRRLFVEFDGDMVAAIVLGEVAHHNIRVALQSQRARGEALALHPHETLGELLPCNAYSVSQATGLPRETVRRKVVGLIRRGWLVRNDRGELEITAMPTEVFADFNFELANGVLELAAALEHAAEPGGRRRR